MNNINLSEIGENVHTIVSNDKQYYYSAFRYNNGFICSVKKTGWPDTFFSQVKSLKSAIKQLTTKATKNNHI